jgi:hypothetical protein
MTEFETSDPWYFEISKFVAFETVRVRSGNTKGDEDKRFFIDHVLGRNQLNDSQNKRCNWMTLRIIKRQLNDNKKDGIVKYDCTKEK